MRKLHKLKALLWKEFHSFIPVLSIPSSRHTDKGKEFQRFLVSAVKSLEKYQFPVAVATFATKLMLQKRFVANKAAKEITI